MIEWQNDRVTEWPSDSVTEWQNENKAKKSDNSVENK